MAFQGAKRAVRSCFTNKDHCERGLGRLVHQGEWHCGSSCHSQPAQREMLAPVQDTFFSDGRFSEEAGMNG